MIPIQFEYETENWVYVPDESTSTSSISKANYVNRPIKHFVTVLSMFTHHYTGERMCKIRDDWMTDAGWPVSDESIVPEAGIINMIEQTKTRVTET